MSEELATTFLKENWFSDKDFEKKVPGLTMLSGDQVGRRIMLADDRITIGRSPEATIMLRDTLTSRLHIAIENFGSDANIGTVVRTANAFAVDTVHIVGRRRWNRRGAMVTDRYQRLRHHASTADLLAFAAEQGLHVVAVDNVPGAVRLETAALPRDCLMLFGREGPGIAGRTAILVGAIWFVIVTLGYFVHRGDRATEVVTRH